MLLHYPCIIIEEEYIKQETIVINKLPELKIGELTARLPIIQGAMGIGVSLSGLAAAVANAGGIGTISGVQTGFKEPDFVTNNLEANRRTIIAQIRRARELSSGIIGINFLAAMNNYKELVMAAIAEGIDIVVSGAGLPLDLPQLVEGTKTKIAPIVSSGKAAAVISRAYDKRFNRTADLFIVEGPEAGGHLGFKKEDLASGNYQTLKEILPEVLEAIRPFEEKYGHKIPVIAAGGIFTGQDIAEYLALGASGVQMATRFVGTVECDADIAFKNTYLNAAKEDIRLIQSPVGMPGRVISNSFTKKLDEEGKIRVKRCYRCLKPCDPATTPYCISDALMHSVEGDEGLVFAGSNAWRVNKIVTVQELMDELAEEAQQYLPD